MNDAKIAGSILSPTFSRRGVLAGGAGLGATSLLATLFGSEALAHHGWATFDTRYAYYVTGPLTSVRWGNPHGEAVMGVERAGLPANWAGRQLPPGANERNARLTMASARPYEGAHRELHLVLAGPEWMARWGLDRPLQAGETRALR
jgi:hypothetical protein